MSSKVIDSSATENGAKENLPARHEASAVSELPFRGRAALAMLSPLAAALVALAIHLLLPDEQLPALSWVDSLPAWLHPYPVLVLVLAAASLFLTLVQWVWRPLRPWLVHHAPLVAAFLLELGLWDLITLKLDWMELPYFPGPDSVLGALIEDRAMLLESTWHSLLLLLAGYAVGVTAGLISGVLIGWSPRARYWGAPHLKVLGPLPATALVPLVMTLSSHSFVSAAALVGLAVWFPVTMLTSAGISNVRLSYLDVARTLGAGRLYLIFRVAIPAALPNIFVGLFMGLVVSFLTLIVAEGIGVQAGLGWYLKWQQGYVEYARVYAAIVIMMVFCSGIMTLLFKVRDRVLRWQKGVIKW